MDTPDTVVPPAQPLQSLVALLQEMRSVIDGLDDGSYAMPAPGRSSGGVGGHVRHCLDHVSALIAATRTGVCAYDRRARGTDVERCRSVALGAVDELSDAVAHLDPRLLSRDVEVESQLDRSGATITTRSTIARELVYVMSHTIHHNAVVSLILQARGRSADPHFGFAPSTPGPGESFACAR